MEFILEISKNNQQISIFLNSQSNFRKYQYFCIIYKKIIYIQIIYNNK